MEIAQLLAKLLLLLLLLQIITKFNTVQTSNRVLRTGLAMHIKLIIH